MNLLLVLALGALTYISRAVAVLFLPPPSRRLQRVLERVPGPLFAGLATLSLVTPELSLVSGPVAAAALGGLIMTPRRSLLSCLIGGLAAYAIVTLVT